MKTKDRFQDVSALKPAGLALAAVVAGLSGKGAPAPEARVHAPLEPAGQSNTYVLDHTNHPSFDEDPDMIIGESEPVPVFGPVSGGQRDLFKG